MCLLIIEAANAGVEPANSSGCPHDDLKYPATIAYGFFETGHYQKNILIRDVILLKVLSEKIR